MSTIKIGFMSSNCPTFSIRDVVQACQEYGFQSFEPRIDWGHGHGIELDAPKERVREARRLLEDAGVGVPCIATGVRNAVPAGKDRDAAVDTVRRAADLCRLAGAPYVRVFGGGAKELDEHTRVALAIDTLAEAAAAIEGSGVRILLETHDFFRSGRMVGRVVDAVDRPEVAALWDTMHPVVVGEAPEETVRLLKADRIRHIHVRDLYLTPKAGGGYETEYCDEYGEGTFPLREINRLLVESGFHGTVSLERIFKPDDARHDAHAFLRTHGRGMRSVHQAG